VSVDEDERITFTVDDGIAWITLNRPDKLNALTDAMCLRFRELLFEVDETDDIKAAIVCGNGRAFCSGADVRQRQLRPPEEMRRLGSPHARGASVSDAFFGFAHWKPVIAAVHGYVLGAALALTLRCDFVVASPSTKFQVTEILRGLDVSRFWSFLTYLGGGTFANDVCLTGRFWSAEEGLNHGMVSRVVAEGEHRKEAEAVARHITSLPPMAIRAVVRNRRLALEELQAYANARVTQGLHLSQDFRESAMAFVEKRQPKFEGQ
jgi:enoyl-CoA hydratase/carnithine racemase